MNTYLNLVNINLVLRIRKSNQKFNSINNLDLAMILNFIGFLDIANFFQEFA